MTARLCLRLSPKTIAAIAELAAIKKITKAAVVEIAVQSLISPDHSDRREAAISRRLDRLIRQNDRLERSQMIASEALTLYIRSWLASSHPIPPEAFAAAQAKGRERYENFVDALAQRLHQGKSLAKEIPEDVFPGGYAPPSGEEIGEEKL
jgi:hypothetical protein